LRAEIGALDQARVFVALGRVAFEACWRLMAERGVHVSPRPPFAHGAVYRTTAGTIVASYHPSRQNTHTGRLTPAMLRSAFRKARAAANRPI
jgi:uracil-DNA glycosylase